MCSKLKLDSDEGFGCAAGGWVGYGLCFGHKHLVSIPFNENRSWQREVRQVAPTPT
jgi:hypothetical protein